MEWLSLERCFELLDEHFVEWRLEHKLGVLTLNAVKNQKTYALRCVGTVESHMSELTQRTISEAYPDAHTKHNSASTDD